MFPPHIPKSSRTFLVLGLLLSVLAPALVPPAAAQGTRADYERAASLKQRTANKVLNLRLDAQWIANHPAFWYRRELPGGNHEYLVVDARQATRQPAFDHNRLAAAITTAAGIAVKPGRLPLDGLKFEAPSGPISFRTNGRSWTCDLQTYVVQAGGAPAPGLKANPAARASRNGGASTSIFFENVTMRTVELSWLDLEGRKQPYGRLGAGERKMFSTYVGHVWLVESRDGEEELGRYTATEPAATVVINEATLAAKEASPAPGERSRVNRQQSPDGKWLALIRDHNLFLRHRSDGQTTQVTFDGGLGNAYSEAVFWSPDSRKLVAVRVTAGAEHKVHLIESSPPDQVQPKLHSFAYLKPGDQLPHPRPVLVDVASARATLIEDTLFPQPFAPSGKLDIHWEKDSSRFGFVYNQRGHQVLRVIAVDAATAQAAVLIDERSDTFIHYSGKQYLHRVEPARELIWMSERDGWNHLYLFEARTGQLKHPITKGEWVVRGVDRVDDQARQIWFRAGGLRPGEDPYQIHHCRINFDGTGLVILTAGDGTHTVQWSPDKQYFVDTHSRPDLAPIHELRHAADGKVVLPLETCDLAELEKTGWRRPERFVAKGRDGTTDIHGVIYRPSNFTPTARYPVIEYIYAGPHDSFVPKRFLPLHGGSVQEMAELGFIVVQMDGMGTSNRSKKFHDVCWQNLGDSGFPDRIAWIKAAAAKYPEMDLTRVGIYGGSAGGQSSTRALLAHGDFYHVAVSDCGCHDNRMDKIWWNEQWMGWPIGPHYEAQSNVTQAHRLQGKLLLIVGELDRNVDPASTLQVVNALVKADKDFEFLVLPGAGHGSAETPYGKRRRADFFVRHLLGTEPRSR